jgi:hypothetical protein
MIIDKIAELKRKKMDLQRKIALKLEEKAKLQVSRKITILIYTDSFNTEDQNQSLKNDMIDLFKIPPDISFTVALSVATIEHYRPDILLLDYGGMSANGMNSDDINSSLNEIIQNHPDLFILFATTFSFDDYYFYIYQMETELKQTIDYEDDPRMGIVNRHCDEWKVKLKNWIDP